MSKHGCYNSSVAKRVRFACLHEQNWLCKYCRTPLTWRTATLDHVQTRLSFVERGEKIPLWGNSVAACYACNNIRGATPFYEFVREIASEAEPDEPRVRSVWERRKRNAALIACLLASASGDRTEILHERPLLNQV
jgi:5-methylcytosine-specific restriction endonuclease McrA